MAGGLARKWSGHRQRISDVTSVIKRARRPRSPKASDTRSTTSQDAGRQGDAMEVADSMEVPNRTFEGSSSGAPRRDQGAGGAQQSAATMLVARTRDLERQDQDHCRRRAQAIRAASPLIGRRRSSARIAQMSTTMRNTRRADARSANLATSAATQSLAECSRLSERSKTNADEAAEHLAPPACHNTNDAIRSQRARRRAHDQRECRRREHVIKQNRPARSSARLLAVTPRWRAPRRPRTTRFRNGA